GQMSSWYVLSAMGIYQIAPGNPYYEIGRPIMDKAIIQLENGKTIDIRAQNNSPENKYVLSVKFNGEVLKQHYISHEKLINGGKLVIRMGKQPVNERSSFEHAPTLSSVPETFIPIPFVEQENRVFDEKMEISLSIVKDQDYTIFYTLDGSIPDIHSTDYQAPFTITENTTVQARAWKDGYFSTNVSTDFVKRDNTISLELFSEYANQYAGGGDLALIDGISGGNEYRTGDWQGYWAQDLVLEVKFDGGRSLSEIGIGCLSDMKSWIFLPKEVVFEVSTDGINFTEVGKTSISPEAASAMSPHKAVYSASPGSPAKYTKVRITVKNFGKCPEWHLGNGNDTWLFVDELIFR
ncbi:MAG: glycoside hydrolase domain-containing protein, partial [Crocinitomicaceae bacterium]